VPLSLGISGANMHDSLGLKPLVRGIPPIRSRRGPAPPASDQAPRRQGSDYNHLRKWLRERRIRHRIARKGIESSARLGQYRWVVERTVSWLAGCRKLHRRYERKAEHYLAFVHPAAQIHSPGHSPDRRTAPPGMSMRPAPRRVFVKVVAGAYSEVWQIRR
jgi:transposase